jgi:WD40 repeat protein
VYCVYIHNNILLSGGADRTIRLWDIASGECTRVLKDHKGSVSDIQVRENRIVSASYDQTIRVWYVFRLLSFDADVDGVVGVRVLAGVSSNVFLLVCVIQAAFRSLLLCPLLLSSFSLADLPLTVCTRCTFTTGIWRPWSACMC